MEYTNHLKCKVKIKILLMNVHWRKKMLDKNELTYVQSHLDFWDKLTPTQRRIVENNIVKAAYSDGYNLYSSDNECRGVILVKQGGLRVYILSEDGREVTLYRLSPGDICILSASCVLKNITFDVHIDVEGDTELYILKIDVFSKLCEDNVYVENFAYKNAIDRFSDVMWAMEQILFMSFDKRLAIFLLDEMVKSNSSVLNITQEQIAKYIGSAREVVSRMLKIFQADGILKQSRGVIHILDKEKLRRLV